MDCKLLDCDEPATVRLVGPFGEFNYCADHAERLGSWWHYVAASGGKPPRDDAELALREASVAASRLDAPPLMDPPLDADSRAVAVAP